ncbi:MAG: hypothetical protein FWE23_06640 [Chitinivibrionia bacterium]|nr:hypothetical protein [Chitinivibrionia bacterium]
MRKKTLLLLTMFLALINVSAQDLSEALPIQENHEIQELQIQTLQQQIPDKRELFEKANRLYSERDFDAALVLYKQILQHHGENSAVMYNISNSAFRNGDIGTAILFLERAKILAPRDPDILANLNFLRRQTVDKFVEEEAGFFKKIFIDFQSLLTLETQIIIILSLSALMVLLLAFVLFSPKRRNLKIYVIMILFVITFILGISAKIKYEIQKNNIRAVIMVEVISAVNEPRGNTPIFTAHEGTVLRIVNTSGDWYFVSLPNGLSGWVQSKFVERI